MFTYQASFLTNSTQCSLSLSLSLSACWVSMIGCNKLWLALESHGRETPPLPAQCTTCHGRTITTLNGPVALSMVPFLADHHQRSQFGNPLGATPATPARPRSFAPLGPPERCWPVPPLERRRAPGGEVQRRDEAFSAPTVVGSMTVQGRTSAKAADHPATFGLARQALKEKRRLRQNTPGNNAPVHPATVCHHVFMLLASSVQPVHSLPAAPAAPTAGCAMSKLRPSGAFACPAVSQLG